MKAYAYSMSDGCQLSSAYRTDDIAHSKYIETTHQKKPLWKMLNYHIAAWQEHKMIPNFIYELSNPAQHVLGRNMKFCMQIYWLDVGIRTMTNTTKPYLLCSQMVFIVVTCNHCKIQNTSNNIRILRSRAFWPEILGSCPMSHDWIKNGTIMNGFWQACRL